LLHYLCKEIFTLRHHSFRWSLSHRNQRTYLCLSLENRVLPFPLEGMILRITTNVPEQVGEHRAAVLLGLPVTEIRRFSRISGLGHLEVGDCGEQVVFTYDELQRLCLLAAQSSK
jgi:hypothetical protein